MNGGAVMLPLDEKMNRMKSKERRFSGSLVVKYRAGSQGEND